MANFCVEEDVPRSWRELNGNAKRRRRPTKPIQQYDDPWWSFNPKVVDGQVCYRIGNLAAALGVSTQSIRRWTRRGDFPRTNLFRSVPGAYGAWPHFTRNQILAAVRIAEEEGLVGKRRWDLRESSFGIRVSQEWKRLHRANL
jgi:hypothetical protein